MMGKEFIYCINKDTCEHSGNCERWVGNLHEDEAIDLFRSKVSFVDDAKCVKSDPIPYIMLVMVD